MFIAGLGAVFFGLTIGWIAHQILRRKSGALWIQDLIALLGIIAGAAALALFRNEAIFGWYAVGLVVGFLASFVAGVILDGQKEVLPWRLKPAALPSTPVPQEAQVPAQPGNGKKQTRGSGKSALQGDELV
jgi:uncharacterized membrane protein YeaQ/YmgE (transglycosylase-associated protein family)